MNYCRSCTRETDDLVLDDIRGDGVLFPVCRSCAEGTVTPAHPVERSYEGAGPSMTAAEMTEALRGLLGDDEYEAQMREAQRPSVAPQIPAEERDWRAMQSAKSEDFAARRATTLNVQRGRDRRKNQALERVGRVK